jgi:uncharacterized protein YbjT (DUF2867 family)
VRIAVAGGTGLLGQHVVDVLRERGHDPLVLARATGVDLVTGSGLAEALQGVDAVVDATNAVRDIAAFFQAVAGNLQEHGAAAGVGHVVTVSIVGIERASGYGYYAAKLAHEQAATAGTVPASIVRATQFHEFPAMVMERTRRGPVAVVPRMRVQPVSARAAAERVAEVAAGPPLQETVQVAGPEQHDLPDLARRLLAHEHTRALVVPVPIPGASGRAMARGALLPEQPYDVLGPAFDDWLTARRG